MADDDASDKEPKDDAAEPETGGLPPPLSGDGSDSEADERSAADSMEDNLPDALKGSSASVALGQGTLSEKDERTFAMLAHILGIVPLVGPLVIWILKKDESPFVDDQGKEAIAYQLIYVIALVVIGIFGSAVCLNWLLWPVAFVGNLILVIIAGMKANEGVAYRYPFALRVF